MPDMAFNPQEYYASQGQISDPGEFAGLYDELPQTMDALVPAIQGLMLHIHWAENHGIILNRLRKAETNIRTAHERLAKITELCNRPLNEPRELPRKTIGTCRDFSLMLASVLRYRKVPARARCGFAVYFTEGYFDDHWVCEYWDSGSARWVLVDGQLDELQTETLRIDFNPLDVPRTNFVTGGQAWQRCRSGQADPNLFGAHPMSGLFFVKDNLVRDFLALNKIEILPWDNFGPIAKHISKMHRQELTSLDRLAAVSSGEDHDFLLLRAAFATNKDDLLPSYFFGSA